MMYKNVTYWYCTRCFY